MCLGVPMQVKETCDGFAICEGMGERRQISTMLVGDQPPGTWLLTFLDAAREVLTAEDAAQRTDALTAVSMVMNGETDIDHLFADLIDREPLPPPSMPTTKQGD